MAYSYLALGAGHIRRYRRLEDRDTPKATNPSATRQQKPAERLRQDRLHRAVQTWRLLPVEAQRRIAEQAPQLRDALPSGQHPLRSAVWDFVRPMLSPRLVELHRDAFVIDDGPQSSVDLAAHRGASGLEALDIGEQDADAA